MGFKHQAFTPENRTITIYPRADKRFLKLIGIYSDFLGFEELRSLDVKIKYKAQTKVEDLCIIHNLEEDAKKPEFLNIHKEIIIPDNCSVEPITVFIEHNVNSAFQFVLVYDIDRLNVSVLNPMKRFEEHLSDSLNPRILFSAPFGSGKTTFLKIFFNPSKSDYEVFHIYPVNFSVSANDDIFKYIKTELLFQLLGRDIDFKKISLPYAETLKKYLGLNAHKVLAPFIRLLPGIGRSLFDIYSNMEELKEQYFDFHENSNYDEEGLAKEYVKAVYDQEGSLFEDNFFTQLIRQLVDQLKEDGKKIVLIIDDLDRMDPEHIFRILNVLSAHVDDYDPLGHNPGNKFGFDKTILVGDFHNLISIFKHRYGINTDYRGYFDKFFSKNIFHYNNVDALDFMVSEISMNDKYKNGDNDKALLLYVILKILVKTENFSLRELLKLFGQGNIELQRSFADEDESFVPFILLNKILTTHEIIIRLERALESYSEKATNREIYYDFYVWMLMINLAEIKEDEDSGQYLNFKYDGNEIGFKTKSDFRRVIVDESSIKINGQSPQKTYNLYTEKDFIRLAILFVKRYREREMMLKNRYEIKI